MNSEFESVFVRLRGILERHSQSLHVTADTPDHYCLAVTYDPKLKKGYPVAWVKVVKAYVGYHFMPVYMFPTLRDGLSEKLRARMQGKSCFNFAKADEKLFEELERLTAEGFARARKEGFGPGSMTAAPPRQAQTGVKIT